jgi:hypothetical protein
LKHLVQGRFSQSLERPLLAEHGQQRAPARVKFLLSMPSAQLGIFRYQLAQRSKLNS